MPTNYRGNPKNITNNFATPTGIGGVTVANPATIVTSPAHGLVTGQYAHVYGHTGSTTLVNGVHQVTVVDATHFSIPVNAGGTDSSATGAVQALDFGSAAIPSDGDEVDAAIVNPSEEFAGDAAAYLGLVTGAWKSALRSPPADAAWQISAVPGVSFMSTVVSGAATWTDSGFPAWTLQTLDVGDVVDVCLTTTMNVSSCAVRGAMKLYASNYVDGASPSYASMAGMAQSGLKATGDVPVTLRGQTVITTAGQLSVKLYIFGQTGGDVVGATGDYNMSMRVWRPTLMPQ
jgi:hypothetical protein